LKVTVNVRVPDWSCAGLGSVALASLEVIWTLFVTVFTTAHVLSTAFTVTVNGMPAT
jgi:hypothetical protein